MIKFSNYFPLNIRKIKLSSFGINKSFNFATNNQPDFTPQQMEKNLMKKLYSKRIDDSIISDYLHLTLKKTPAFIIYKGDIRMDYYAKYLDDYKIPITVLCLDLNPVLNEAFVNFYPYINQSNYLLFLKGKLIDTEEFNNHISKGTVEDYFKGLNLFN